MATFEITDHGNGNYSVRETTYDDPVDMPLVDGLIGFSAIACYLIAFVGMLVMLINTIINAAGVMLFPAILAMGVFLLPVLAKLFGRSSKSLLSSIAKHAFLLFNVFVAMWWALYASFATGEGLLIGMLVVTMYAMYYFPAILIYHGSKNDTKLGVVGAVVSIVLAFAVYLTMLATFSEENPLFTFLPIVFSTTVTVSGTLFLLLIRFVAMTRDGVPVGKRLRLPLIYLLAAAFVVVFSVFVIPAENEERYETALQCVEDGDYKQARVLFADLGRYKDAAARLNEIRFAALQVGETVTLGNQADEPLTWTVVSVEDGRALLFADAILTSVSSSTPYGWEKNHTVRSALKDLLYCFSEEELARLVPYTYTVADEKGEITVTDTLFLPSQAELEGFTAADIFSGKDTSYNDNQVLDYQMADFDYTYVYAYFVRSTDGTWTVADCDAQSFVAKNKDHRYVGIRPAVYVTIDTAEASN